MLEISVAARELVQAEPTATIGTQGRRMDRLEHEVLLFVNHIGL